MDSFPIINKTYDVYKSLTQLSDGLEKRWRFSLGQSTETTLLELLSKLIMAKNAPKALKGSFLIEVGAHLEVLTLKLRLILDLKLANETKIFQIQAKLEEIGRMLGGWIKAVHSTT